MKYPTSDLELLIQGKITREFTKLGKGEKTFTASSLEYFEGKHKNFIDVVAWGFVADRLIKETKKNDIIHVTCTLRQEAVKDQHDNSYLHKKITISIWDFEVIGGEQDVEPGEINWETPSNPELPQVDDDDDSWLF